MGESSPRMEMETEGRLGQRKLCHPVTMRELPTHVLPLFRRKRLSSPGALGRGPRQRPDITTETRTTPKATVSEW